LVAISSELSDSVSRLAGGTKVYLGALGAIADIAIKAGVLRAQHKACLALGAIYRGTGDAANIKIGTLRVSEGENDGENRHLQQQGLLVLHISY
jgi:hypothetical protein